MSPVSRFPTTRLLLTDVEFCAWLGQAGPGERVEYHRGFLVVDVARGSSTLPEPDRNELVRLGRRAMRASQHGFVDLVQRRHAAECFSYLAVARARPTHAQAVLLGAADDAVPADPNLSLRQSHA